MAQNQTPLQTRIIDPILTSRVQGYKDTAYVWDQLFPPVPVNVAGGQILEFGAESFKLYNTKRAPGAATVRASFGYAGKPFALLNDAIEVPVPREYQRDAQVTPGIDLGERAALMAMRVLNRQIEKEAADLARNPANYATGNSVTVAAGDRWSAPNTNPIAQLNVWREVIRSKIGLEPNVLFLAMAVFRALQTNEFMLERVKYTTAESLTAEMMARVFDVEKIVIGRSVYATDAGDVTTGTPPTYVDVWGKDVILAYVPQVASMLEEPSFGYTYQMVGHPLVEEPYYDNNSKAWYFGCSWERVPVITSSIAGFLAMGVVA